MRFQPRDIALAYGIFGANCGPASFAALVGRDICEIMRHFRQFPEKQWTTTGQMRTALAEYGVPCERLSNALPSHGVALIQFTGPWTASGAHWAARLRRTHWVACVEGHVFDINLPQWLTTEEWRASCAEVAVRETPNCSGWVVAGGWTVRCYATCRSCPADRSVWSKRNVCIGVAGDERRCAVSAL